MRNLRDGLPRRPRDADRFGLELRRNERRLRGGLDNFDFMNTSIMTGEGWEVSTKTGQGQLDEMADQVDQLTPPPYDTRRIRKASNGG